MKSHPFFGVLAVTVPLLVSATCRAQTPANCTQLRFDAPGKLFRESCPVGLDLKAGESRTLDLGAR